MTREEIIRKVTDTKDYCNVGVAGRMYAEYHLKEYENQIRADEFDTLSKSIKTNWLFRGKDGKPYREEIDKIVEELKGKK